MYSKATTFVKSSIIPTTKASKPVVKNKPSTIDLINSFFASTNEYCEKISLNFTKRMCYEDIALKKSDVSFCFKGADYSLSSCILNIALKTKNVNYCELIEDEEKDACYYHFAIMSDKPELCIEITSSIDLHSICYGYFAGKRKDDSFCDKIMRGYAIVEEYSYYYDPDVMESFGDRTFKEVCRENPIMLMLIAPEITTEDSYSLGYVNCDVNPHECSLDEITKSEEFERCDEIEYEPYKILCLHIKEDNASSCESYDYNNDLCYFKFAVYHKEIELCKSIDNLQLRDRCIGMVAIELS